MSVVMHGAGRDLTVAGPVCCRDCFETDHRGMLPSRREGGVEEKRVTAPGFEPWSYPCWSLQATTRPKHMYWPSGSL